MKKSTQFNVGVTAELFSTSKPEPYPAIDLSLLLENPRINVIELPDYDGAPLDASVIHYLDAVLTANAAVSRESLAEGCQLSLVSRIASGFNDIDLGAMTEAGIAYSRAGGPYGQSVALAGMTLMLSTMLRLGEKMAFCAEGEEGWFNGSRIAGVDPCERVMGLVGLGSIGQEFLRLTAPLGMKRLVHTSTKKEGLEDRLNFSYSSIEDIVVKADVVVLACALSDETRHLLSRDRLQALKPGAFIVNVGRGELVEEAVLISELQKGRLRGAGLDVTMQEPLPGNSELHALRNAIVTPHSLGVTDRSHRLAGEEALGAIEDLLIGKNIRNLENDHVRDNAKFQKKQRDIISRQMH